MFDGWDADVILNDRKIAILWDGIWHYKQISKTRSLLQVQTRDRIKRKIIESMGYRYYTIKDMGKFNPRFVNEQFQIFLYSIIDY